MGKSTSLILKNAFCVCNVKHIHNEGKRNEVFHNFELSLSIPIFYHIRKLDIGLADKIIILRSLINPISSVLALISKQMFNY